MAARGRICALLREGQTRREAGTQTQSLGASCVGGSRVAEQGGGATKLRPYEDGGTRMAAEDHDGGRLPSANPTKVVHPLDDPARDLGPYTPAGACAGRRAFSPRCRLCAKS